MTAANWSFTNVTLDSSRERWAYGEPGATGEILITPTVNFGGDSIYFETINTATVALKRETIPDGLGGTINTYPAEQPRIGMTYIESMEWEEVAWSREVEIEDYETSTGLAKLDSSTGDYLVYPDYMHHPEITPPMDHNKVRAKVELGAAVPEGMKGTLHLAWYDPINTVANIGSPTHDGHGVRDNDATLSAAGGGLPGFTLEFTTAGPSEDSDLIRKSYLAINDARYRDNFIVVAHPHTGIVENFKFQEKTIGEETIEVLCYQENTGLWKDLPDSSSGDHITSILTILPSVDIDCDSDNTGSIERSDREEEIENVQEYIGKYVAFNSDDDNGNGIADYLENADYDYPPGMSWVPFTDNDLVQVVLDRGFDDLAGMDGFIFELKVTADTQYGLKYWLNPEKDEIVNGTNGGDPVPLYEASKWKDVYTWEVSSGAVAYPTSIYVEGINADAITDTIMWRLFKPIPPTPPETEKTYELVDVDTVKLTDPWLDLDIDSDNSGWIDHSQDEEDLEEHLYGLGKWIPLDDPLGVDMELDFTANWNTATQIRFCLRGVLGPGSAGDVQISYLDVNGVYQYLPMGNSVTLGSLLVIDNRAFFRVKGVAKNNYVETYKAMEEAPSRHVTAIAVEMYFPSSFGLNWVEADRVQYFVAGEYDFLPAVVQDDTLRAALAARGIYEQQDLRRYGMQLQYAAAYQAISPPMDYGRYRDYCNYHDDHEYILAFQGTDFTSVEQWISNFGQAFGSSVGVYQHAINLMVPGSSVYDPRFFDASVDSRKHLIVGHSLGGGLASAAAITSGIEAVTFNAAGLHNNQRNSMPPVLPPTAAITAYQVDYDVLTNLQESELIRLFGTNVPQAVTWWPGGSVELTSQYASDEPNLIAQLKNVISLLAGTWTNIWSSLAGRPQDERDYVHIAGTCHTMPQVIYGLLERDQLQTAGRDAFGYPKQLGYFLPWKK